MNIRTATPQDAANLLEIYRQYIDTSITFEYALPSISEFKRRISDTLKDYPFLVGIEDGQIVGYNYAHRIQIRDAYQWGAELSIYLDKNLHGRGWGTRLYVRLIKLLQAQGVRTVYGCVTTPNPVSEHFHEKLGFERIGLFKNAGFKNEEWHDIAWYAKNIGKYDVPSLFIPFSKRSNSSFNASTSSINIAPCGLICSRCDAYRATQENSPEKHELVTANWRKLNLCDDTGAEYLTCDGCLNATGRKSYFCANMCEIRHCVVEKRRRSCSGCPEYPCDKLNTFLKSAPEEQAKAMRNLLEAIAGVEQNMHSAF